jgi:hypothetical protein
MGVGEGYITFQYLQNDVDSDFTDTYCVLYWENFDSDGTADMHIAYSVSSPGDTGLPTQDAAEAEYTIENGNDYYYDIEPCTKQ